MSKKPTREQIKNIADNIYCCLDDEQLIKVVEAAIAEWEEIRDLDINPCNCGQSNLEIIEQNEDANGLACVIVCNSCKRFSVGKTKKEAVQNWNKRVLNTKGVKR